MTKMTFRKAGLCLVLTLLTPFLLSGCGGSTGGEARTDTVSGTGTVHYKSFEGGFYAIDGDSGHNYDPTNLGADFKKDGLRVQYEVKPRPELGGTHGYGEIADIVKISVLK